MTGYAATVFDMDNDTPVSCGSCEWGGTASELLEIGDAILTPGDPSPAGRCPECESLAYVEDPPPLYNLTYEIGSHGEGVETYSLDDLKLKIIAFALSLTAETLAENDIRITIGTEND